MNITGVMVQYYAGGSYGSSWVSEELNSVETVMHQHGEKRSEAVSEELRQFQKNLIVWKLVLYIKILQIPLLQQQANLHPRGSRRECGVSRYVPDNSQQRGVRL